MSEWLVGWKTIAAYLKCHVQTAQFYAKKHDLPIKKLPGDRPAALPKDLDQWLSSQPFWRTHNNHQKTQ